MNKSVYLLKETTEAQALEIISFERESELQEIIAKNPQLLLCDSDENNELYLVKRELLLPGTFRDTSDLYLDHFMVDKFGMPVLVEVKLIDNPEIRRKVVGQMMEYAARISAYDSTELQELFARENGRMAPTDNSLEFWKTVSSNLRVGRMKLVFAADTIPTTLKLIIEMLDRTMHDIDVYGVEIKKYDNNGQKCLSTNYIMNTEKTIIRQTESFEKKVWTDRDLEARLNEHEWAFRFFTELRNQCESIGFSGKYGTAGTYIPFRWYYNGQVLFTFDTNAETGSAGIYFNTRVIESLTKQIIKQADLRQKLTEIDPDAKYAKSKTYVYLRTKLKYYEDVSKQGVLFDLLSEIMGAIKDTEMSQPEE